MTLVISGTPVCLYPTPTRRPLSQVAVSCVASQGVELVPLRVTGRHPTLGSSGDNGVCQDRACWTIPGRKGLLAIGQCPGTDRDGEGGQVPVTPSSTPSLCGRPRSSALTGSGSDPGACSAGLSRQAELRELVWSSRREADPLLFWTGVARGGPGISLVQDPSLLGGGLLCAGVICEGLGTRERSAGFTRNRQLLGMWCFPVQGLRVFRHHLTNQTQVTPPLLPSNSTPFHFKGLWTCHQSRTVDQRPDGCRLPALCPVGPCTQGSVDRPGWTLSWAGTTCARALRRQGSSWGAVTLGLGCASLSLQSLMEGIP